MLKPSSHFKTMSYSSSVDDKEDAFIDDRTLLTRIKHGDEQAMEALYRRFSGPVYLVARRVLQDSGQAEDVMQLIFLQLWKSTSGFHREGGSLGAWLIVVARNKAIDSLRRRKPSDSINETILASPFNLAEEAERNVLMTRVRRALVNLPDEQRQTLELAFFEGLSHAEIAARINIPLGTVKTRIRIALMRLRKTFNV